MDQTAKTNENTQIHTKIIGAIEKKNMGWKSFLEIEETLCKYMRNDYPVLEIAAISEKIK